MRGINEHADLTWYLQICNVVTPLSPILEDAKFTHLGRILGASGHRLPRNIGVLEKV